MKFLYRINILILVLSSIVHAAEADASLLSDEKPISEALRFTAPCLITAGKLSVGGSITFTTLINAPNVAPGVVQVDAAGVLSSTQGTNGQVLIGATGNAPAWRNITSSDSSITITNGANSIDITTAGGGGGNVIGPVTPVTVNAVTLFTDATHIKQSALNGTTSLPVTIDASTNMANVNNLTITANFNMPATGSSGAQGVITTNSGVPWIHLGTPRTTIGSSMYAGYNAGDPTATANNNAAFGSSALHSASAGDNNTAVGYQTLLNCTGSNNIAIGSGAGRAITTGNSDIYIGADAASASETSTIRIGSSGHSACFIAATRTTLNALTLSTLGAGVMQADSSGAVTSTNGTDGQLLFVSPLTHDPAWTTLISSDSTVLITVGSNSINLQTAAGGGNVIGPVSPPTVNALALFTDATHIKESALNPVTSLPVVIDVSSNMINVNDVTITGNINLPVSQGSGITVTQGALTQSGSPLLHTGSPDGFDIYVGQQAGLPTSVGLQNVAVGYQALSSIISGMNNCAVGYGALPDVTTSSNNSGFGSLALQFTTGDDNTACGANALTNCSTGSNNIAIGSGAGRTITTGNSGIYIGADATTDSESGIIRIGTSPTNSACFVAGIYGITTGSGTTQQVLIDINGQLGTASSSARYKKDIKTMEKITALLMKLHPVRFKYKIHEDNVVPEYGLIAEEVAAVAPDLVIYKDGHPESVKYHLLPPLLIKAVQELVIKNEEQDSELAECKKQLERVMHRIEPLEESVVEKIKRWLLIKLGLVAV